MSKVLERIIAEKQDEIEVLKEKLRTHCDSLFSLHERVDRLLHAAADLAQVDYAQIGTDELMTTRFKTMQADLQSVMQDLGWCFACENPHKGTFDQ